MRRIAVPVVCVLAASWVLSAQQAPPPATPQPAPQQQQQPVFRGEIDVIRVDASVIDKDRRPIRGLKLEDFSVYEDGKPQRLVAVSEIDTATNDPVPSAWMRNVPRDIAANNLGDQIGDGRVVAIVMDDWNVPFDDLDMIMNARAVGRYIVDTLAPSDVAAVIFPQLAGKTEDFTDDRRKLLAAIEKFEPPELRFIEPTAARADRRRGRHAVSIEPDADAQSVPAIAADDPDTRHAGVAPGDDSEPAQDGFSGQHRHPAQSWRHTGLPGRARRHDARRVPSRAAGEHQHLQRRSGRVPGLRELPPESDPPRRPAGRAGRERSRARRRRRSSAATSSRSRPTTRARARSSTTTMSARRSIRFSTRQARTTCSVSDVQRQARRQIPSPRDQSEPAGRFRADPVRVLRTERGHDRRSQREGHADAGDLGLTGMMAPAALPLRAALIPVARTAGPGSRQVDVAVVLTVRLPAIRGALAENVTLVRTLYDAEGRAGPPTPEKIQLTLTGTTGDELRYDLYQRLTLLPGRYSIRLNATSSAIDRSGSVYADIEVPDFTRPPLSASAIILGTKPAGSERKDVLAAVLPIVPTSARDFAANDAPLAFVRLFQGGETAIGPVTVKTQILDASDVKVFEGSETIAAEAFDASRSAAFEVALPIAPFAHGPYLLSISATLPGGASTRRDLVFRMR